MCEIPETGIMKWKFFQVFQEGTKKEIFRGDRLTGVHTLQLISQWRACWIFMFVAYDVHSRYRTVAKQRSIGFAQLLYSVRTKSKLFSRSCNPSFLRVEGTQSTPDKETWEER